jgi:hypothetical protein
VAADKLLTMNPIIRAVVFAGAIMFGGVVIWSWADFATQPARVEIANASGNQVGSNQVPSPTQPPPSHPAQVSMKAADWSFQDSTEHRLQHPLQHSFGWRQFVRRGSRDFLITTASPVLIQGRYVKMIGIIYPASVPVALCQIYFQGASDETFYGGAYRRWWSKYLALGGGGFVQVVRLEPQFWSPVLGGREWGDASPYATAGFQQALANPQSIGIMCGGFGGREPDLDPGIMINKIDDPIVFEMDSFAVCDPFRQPRRGPFRDRADIDSARQENWACAPPHQLPPRQR